MTEDEFETEIQRWAYDADAPEPQQDFDLFIAGWMSPLFVRFAIDNTCPKQDYFLNVLYLITCDVLESERTASLFQTLKELTGMAEAASATEVQRWARETEQVLSDSSTYSFDYWGSEGWRKQS
jgi:hypothetical protein